MIYPNGHNYKNWPEYINSTFEASKKYARAEVGPLGDSIVEKYIPLDISNRTVIEVAYLNDKLLHLKFENPLTIGYNKQQEPDYFCRYDYTPDDSYGDPGLEFIDINIQALDNLLKEGLKGEEVQYYKDNQLIKSVLFIYYYGNTKAYPDTIYFTKVGFWKHFRDTFFGAKDEHLVKKEIDLSEIFGGLAKHTVNCHL